RFASERSARRSRRELEATMMKGRDRSQRHLLTPVEGCGGWGEDLPHLVNQARAKCSRHVQHVKCRTPIGNATAATKSFSGDSERTDHFCSPPGWPPKPRPAAFTRASCRVHSSKKSASVSGGA